MFAVRVRPVPVFARSQNSSERRRSRTLTKQLRGAIDHARLLCVNHEDTRECQVAWDQVEELAKTLHRETLREVEQARLELTDPEVFSDIEKRFYDV